MAPFDVLECGRDSMSVLLVRARLCARVCGGARGARDGMGSALSQSSVLSQATFI